MTNVTIDCMYSCILCGVEKAHVAVPARTDEQDVKFWMEQVAIPAFAKDHALRSASCLATTLTGIYIPLTGTKMIGGPCEQ